MIFDFRFLIFDFRTDDTDDTDFFILSKDLCYLCHLCENNFTSQCTNP